MDKNAFATFAPDPPEGERRGACSAPIDSLSRSRRAAGVEATPRPAGPRKSGDEPAKWRQLQELRTYAQSINVVFSVCVVLDILRDNHTVSDAHWRDPKPASTERSAYDVLYTDSSSDDT